MPLSLLLAVTMIAPPASLESFIVQYRADLGSLERKYPIAESPTTSARMRAFYADRLKQLEDIDLRSLDADGKLDLALLINQIDHEVQGLDIQAQVHKQVSPLVPFGATIVGLEESRLGFDKIEPEKAANKLAALAKAIRANTADLRSQLETGKLAVTNGVDAKPTTAEWAVSRSTAYRATAMLESLRNHFGNWHRFYQGYDPIFTWWCSAPYKDALAALDEHTAFVRERLVGIAADDKTTIIGFPIGREALQAELDFEQIAYSPEELLAIAEREFAWCEKEMQRAAKDLGKKDWAEALEYVKEQHVAPGEQPQMIRELAEEAIQFVEKRDLVTVPDLAKETWRMEMMSPEAQLRSPFFLGGEQILVSYPTDAMSHDAKRMSMRGNNRYFARATVQHELIPGHHLQMFMMDRYRPYRTQFQTPFWIEGWALYWEMLLWDQGFPRTPEERVGMLFWRSHRAARIIFSLSFHLGKMTPDQCVDMLVHRVGHERDNALAEVRRSFAGDYGPLYQAAYMLGGLQIMALKRELVDAKKMTFRQFHDAILQGNTMPIDFVRARLKGEDIVPRRKAAWRFAG
ncbi:MAG: DUF885 family protein [Fimbriimonas sp.]